MMPVGRATVQDRPRGTDREEARVDKPAIEPLELEDEVFVRWIDTHWDALAAFAWQHYVQVGRGLVLVTAAEDGKMVVEYETPDAAAAGDDVWPEELRTALGDYNPALEVLFLLEPEGAG